jgi:hypothetical protein
MKQIIKITLLVFFLCIITVCADAATSKLEIDHIEITSDEKVLLRSSGNSGKIKIDPAQDLVIQIKLENNYADNTENDIENVRVVAAIEGIDDGKDLWDDSEELRVRADSYKTVKLRLEVPEDASSYESYDLEISATGRDQNGTEHSDSAVFELEVKREEHELVFEKLYVNDVYCGDDARVRLELRNTGEEYEEDVELKIIIDGYGTAFMDNFDLAEIDEEDEINIYSLSKALDTEGIRPGRHGLIARAEYDDRRKSTEKEIEFSIHDCGTSAEYDAETEEEPRVEVLTERYSNPKRELSWLFGENKEVILEMPPTGAIIAKYPVAEEEKKGEGFSIFVLLLGCVAVIAGIIFVLTQTKASSLF